MNFRFKNFLVSVIFPLLFIQFLNVANFQDGVTLYGSILISTFILYFSLFWLMNFYVHPTGFVTVLLLPAVFFASFLVIYISYIQDLKLIYQLPILSFYAILQYYLGATQNILNLSHFKLLSLSQAAYTTNTFYTILTFFISCIGILMLSRNINILTKFSLIGVSFLVNFAIYSMLNKVSRTQYILASSFYISFLFMTVFTFVAGVLVPQKLILLGLVYGLVFKDIIVLTQYSLKRIISLFDYFQVILESGLIFFILWYMTKI